jgi:hypothetical protein
MGALASCAGGSKLPDIDIDLVNPTPADASESDVVSQISLGILDRSPSLLARYTAYQDCQQLIAVAISNPTPANIDAAWAAAIPAVRLQSEVFDFACSVVSGFQGLADYVVAQPGRMLDILEQHPATTKMIGALLNTTLLIDATMMKLPRLLGDLSFFRRTASRRPDFADYDDLYQKSSEMSMFFAIPSPLLTKILGSIQGNTRNPQERTRSLEMLAALVDVYACMHLNHRSGDQELNLLCCRTIVAAVLLYDSLSSAGAFHAKSGMRAVPAVEAVATAEPRQPDLLNLIKYGSKHYRDPTTQKEITELIH